MFRLNPCQDGLGHLCSENWSSNGTLLLLRKVLRLRGYFVALMYRQNREIFFLGGSRYVWYVWASARGEKELQGQLCLLTNHPLLEHFHPLSTWWLERAQPYLKLLLSRRSPARWFKELRKESGVIEADQLHCGILPLTKSGWSSWLQNLTWRQKCFAKNTPDVWRKTYL